MKRLPAAIRMEARLHHRHGLFLAAMLAAGLLGVAALAVPGEARAQLLPGALFAYALACGFGGAGYRMARDRRDGVLETLDMSPLSPLESMAARIAVAAALAVPGALLVALAGRGTGFQALPLLAGVGAGSGLAALAGILAAAWHRAGRGWALWSPVYVLAMAAPLYPVFTLSQGAGPVGGTEAAPAWFLWHPLQGPLTLLEGAFAAADHAEAALGVAIALPWAGAALVLCKRALGGLRERGRS